VKIFREAQITGKLQKNIKSTAPLMEEHKTHHTYLKLFPNASATTTDTKIDFGFTEVSENEIQQTTLI